MSILSPQRDAVEACTAKAPKRFWWQSLTHTPPENLAFKTVRGRTLHFWGVSVPSFPKRGGRVAIFGYTPPSRKVSRGELKQLTETAAAVALTSHKKSTRRRAAERQVELLEIKSFESPGPMRAVVRFDFTGRTATYPCLVTS